MRKLALWVLVCLAPSCGGSLSGVVFSGTDTAAPDGKLGIVAHKDKGGVTVMRLDHLLRLDLPYAEDWKAESSPDRLIYASSSAAEVIATVHVFKLEKPADDEAYLRDQVLKSTQEAFEKGGGRFKDIAFSQHHGLTDNVLLEYLAEVPLENGTAFRQMHFWSVRHENGRFYRAHVSTSCATEPKRTEQIRQLRDFVGRRFGALPMPQK